VSTDVTASIRACSREASVVSTSVFGRGHAGNRTFSGCRSISQASSRVSYESTLLASVRQQLEALELKFAGKLNRGLQLSEKLREADVSRLEEKVSLVQSVQPKHDRRIAELTGNCKGFSDEMQAQIRRVDQMDARLREWRHQIEEDVRHKSQDLEHKVRQLSSGARVMAASVEEMQKQQNQQQLRLEAGTLDYNQIQEGLMEIHHRVTAVEQTQAAPQVPNGDLNNEAMFAIIQKRLEHVYAKVDHMFCANSDLVSQVAAQEEQLKALRTLHASQEQQHKSLVNRIDRSDWDGKVDRLHVAVKQDSKNETELLEKARVLSERVQILEEDLESLREAHAQIHQDIHPACMKREVVCGAYGCPSYSSGHVKFIEGDADATSMEDCLKRLDESERRLAALDAEMAAVRVDSNLMPAATEIKQIAPNVLEHRDMVRNLHIQQKEQTEEVSHAFECIKRLRADILEVASRASHGTGAGQFSLQQTCEKASGQISDLSQKFDDLRANVEVLVIQQQNYDGPQHAESIASLQRDLDLVSKKIITKQEHDSAVSVLEHKLLKHEQTLVPLTAQLESVHKTLHSKTRELQLCHQKQVEDLNSLKGDASFVHASIKKLGTVDSLVHPRDLISMVTKKEHSNTKQNVEGYVRSQPLLESYNLESKCQQQFEELMQVKLQINGLTSLLSQVDGPNDFVLRREFTESMAAEHIKSQSCINQSLRSELDYLINFVSTLGNPADFVRRQELSRSMEHLHTRMQGMTTSIIQCLKTGTTNVLRPLDLDAGCTFRPVAGAEGVNSQYIANLIQSARYTVERESGVHESVCKQIDDFCNMVEAFGAGSGAVDTVGRTPMSCSM